MKTRTERKGISRQRTEKDRLVAAAAYCNSAESRFRDFIKELAGTIGVLEQPPSGQEEISVTCTPSHARPAALALR